MAKGQKYHCGPEKSPKYIRRVLSKWSDEINQLCKVHDETHSRGSGVSREESDKIFFRYYKNSKSWIKGLLALIYFKAVSRFGAKHYAGDQPKEEDEEMSA